MEVKLNVKEIFDYNNDFELIMFQVFVAKNDIVRVNGLMKKAETQSELFFLFKIMLGLLRESVELIRLIDEKYKEKLQCFNNCNEIIKAIDEYVKLSNGRSKDNFSGKVLRAIRNQVFHYSKIKELQKFFPNMLDDEGTVEIGNTEEKTNFNFIDSVLFGYISSEFESFNGSGDLNEFINKITPYSLHIKDLLEILIEGYLEENTALTDDDYLRRKR